MSDTPGVQPVALPPTYRNVAAIVVSLALMQAAGGALSMVTPLALSAAGTEGAAIGMVIACHAGGFLLGARAAAPAIARIGHVRCFAASAAVAAALALALYFHIAALPWAAIQAGIGLCTAVLLATGESWVADAAPPARRGAVLGFYLITSKLGTVAGPLAAAACHDQAARFMVVGGLMALSLVPVAATRRGQPSPPSAQPFGPGRLWRQAPASVLGATAAGMVNGAVLQLYALYAAPWAQAWGMRPSAAAAGFNIAMIAGTLLLQWPAGWLSDRGDRRLVIAILSGMGAAAGAALALLPGAAPPAAVFALAALWGAGALSFYGVAVAHAADRAAPGEATGMMSGILMVWAGGAIAGPLLAGLAMQSPLGPRGLFAVGAVALAALAGAMVLRRREMPPPPAEEKLPFAPALATSVAAAEIDPRALADATTVDGAAADEETSRAPKPAAQGENGR